MSIKIYTDGACEPNPGLMGIGYVIKKEEVIFSTGKLLGQGTNNIAEFQAVKSALEKCLELGLQNEQIVLYCDNDLVVNVVNGRWEAKHPNITTLATEVKEIKSSFSNLHILWIPNTNNGEADTLSRCGTLHPKIYPSFKQYKNKKNFFKKNKKF